ncbi:hypothetical protein GGX14DRAFT_597037 [Mycena pura]|uniref:Uncharacterized protein n=1 Tax=Mycena pura TaxID=153505 RepID=A0AAD6UPR4_9AGAR|nr:hypothetical protein GGX14DRAFT_597037 [Mycena pura]
MAPTPALLAFMFLTVAASLNVPTCAPGEQANVVSESMFPVVRPLLINSALPVVSPFGNNPTITLTLTFFTCPSLQTHQAQARRGALKRQSEAPIDVCPRLQEGFGATFGCGPGDQPSFGDDCAIIDDTVGDNLIRPLELLIPPLSGVVVTLFNNTCAFVFSNNDANDTYEMELECIPDALLNIENSESCRGKEQGPSFGLSVPSPANPNGANWALE